MTATPSSLLPSNNMSEKRGHDIPSKVLSTAISVTHVTFRQEQSCPWKAPGEQLSVCRQMLWTCSTCSSPAGSHVWCGECCPKTTQDGEPLPCHSPNRSWEYALSIPFQTTATKGERKTNIAVEQLSIWIQNTSTTEAPGPDLIPVCT